ncbi:MAG: hypothetical protein HQK87_06995 [Nitrospinae bacterium]|nr:hypothetical protein [Nitrospinota bacterium]
MSDSKSVHWGGSLHQTFRLLPVERHSGNLRPFLESHGLTPDEILDRLPYHEARAVARGGGGGRPDPKRYRDGKQVYQTIGLLYEGSDGRIRVTSLGEAVRRWIDIIRPGNSVILARHAAWALAACQLKNPTGAGDRFPPDMQVFPFAFIWRAMLALDGKIGSDELNRAILKVRNEDELGKAIEKIAHAREMGDIESLGGETLSEKAKNDRIIPWMSLASFGWTLFPDKRGGSGYYELIPETMDIVAEASRISFEHREYRSTAEYVEHIADCAALPKDLR